MLVNAPSFYFIPLGIWSATVQLECDERWCGWTTADGKIEKIDGRCDYMSVLFVLFSWRRGMTNGLNDKCVINNKRQLIHFHHRETVDPWALFSTIWALTSWPHQLTRALLLWGRVAGINNVYTRPCHLLNPSHLAINNSAMVTLVTFRKNGGLFFDLTWNCTLVSIDWNSICLHLQQMGYNTKSHKQVRCTAYSMMG